MKEIKKKNKPGVFDLFVFDGTTAISLTPPDNLPQFVVFKRDGEETKITISFIKTLPTKDKLNLEVNNIINVLTKKYLRALNLMLIGRNYFYKKPIEVRGMPLKIFKGFTFVMNAALGGKLNVIIDLTSRVMQEKSVRSMMDQVANDVRRQFGRRPQAEINTEIQRRVQHTVSGMVVLCQYNHCTWRIDHVDWTKSLESTFDCGGKEMTYRDYYLQQYNIKVTSTLPGLLVSVKKRKGEIVKKTLLIPELCNPTGVTEEMKNNFKVMKALSLNTRLPPSKRVSSINYLVSQIINDNKSKKDISKLPLKLDPNPCKIKGRLMEPFDISFKRGSTRIAANKSFMRDVQNVGFINGSTPINNWVFAYAKRDERQAKNFGRSMIQISGKKGCQFGQPLWLAAPDVNRDRVSAWRKIMTEAIKKKTASTSFFVAWPRLSSIFLCEVRLYRPVSGCQSMYLDQHIK